MANNITIVSGESTVKATVREQQTTVKTITVGTPIRRVSRSGGDIDLGDLNGITTVGSTDGAMLVYNGTTQEYEPKTDLINENTVFNGGNF